MLPRSAPEDGHPKDKEQGISSANIPKLPGHGTCSANEALTIKRAASSAVGLFPGGVPTTRMSMISICTSNATRAPDRGVKTAKNGRKEGRKERRGMRVGHKQKVRALSGKKVRALSQINF